MIRRSISDHAQTVDWGVLAVDFRNGFNECSRNVILSELNQKLPSLCPWFRWTYGQPNQLVLADGSKIENQTGVCQGDPLSPLYFCLALQPLLLKLRGDDTDARAIIRAYMDDVTICGPVPFLRESLKFLRSEEALARGLHVRTDKCMLYFPNQGVVPLTRLTRLYHLPEELPLSTEGVTILGVPVGSPSFTEAELVKPADSVSAFCERLSILESPQIEHLLLRYCVGASSIMYILRSLPSGSDCVAALAEKVDISRVQVLSRIVGCDFDSSHSTILQFTLPLSMGGLGLTSTGLIRHAAFLASLSTVEARPDLLQSLPSVAIRAEIDSALELYNTQVDPARSLSMEALLGNGPLPQRTLTRAVHDFCYNMLYSRLQPQDCVRLKEQTKVGASAWMSPAFIRGHLIIPSDVYPLLLVRHLGLRFFDPERVEAKCLRTGGATQGPRPFCHAPLDPFLRHTDLCRLSFYPRHHGLVSAFRRLASWAGIPSLAEIQCFPGSSEVPADIFFEDSSGKSWAVDVSVTSPHRAKAPDQNQGALISGQAGATIAKVEASKLAKYASSLALNPNIRFTPFVMSTYGGHGHHAAACMDLLATALSEQWNLSLSEALNFVHRFLCNSLMRSIGFLLSHAVTAIGARS